MKAILIPGLIGVIVGALLLYILFWPKVEETTKTSVETIWVEKDTTIYNYRDTLLYRVVDVQPSQEPEKYDSIRTYKGVETFQYGSLAWEARTLGALDFVKFTPTIRIPTKTVTIENNKVIKQKALYAQFFAETGMHFEVGVSYVNDRAILSYAYSPEFNTHRAGIGIKLIGK